MKKVFKRPEILKDVPFHYCPGCTHGVAHRLVAEVIEELGIRDIAIGVAPVGCSVFVMDYFEIDMFQGSHGRAPAVATGIKRVLPDRVVFTYQGDGDLAAIGTGEFVHAATRGEKITVIFINNAIYGMTGGQMAPTTIMGQVTKTTPFGRDRETNGYPIRVCEMLVPLEGAAYLARVAVHTPKAIIQAKKFIKRAFEVQLAGLGFSLVEVLSACPTNWGLSPLEAVKWLEENMVPYYPLGEYKSPAGGAIND
ncbi:MAG TPA: thiamine pyrophosphate-dependent enzyme [Bacillota bacterium]|jgi:2-oxoglutarate ferredoxin oxidoreductase subunit beta|nr:thiamine pyrophosphate-dependent enzyme [Peptococcaceae bacterium MAG4]NLW38888.1 2-oxoglutarate oxidoreductase [Peptococcaceae bacterium]HPU36076.1 thiamine pyrophosphate-dependent enzyme [Bacillota bacterium]HPZ42499.1 thiamine pyrophosphate-dependent enzyme [Bacillota bacterium]HQD75291.1 thiamine pyrophosphate-dependent enzyme [Bacillota bacterium]